MSTLYTGISCAVGALALLTAAWKLGHWQAKQEDRIEAQDEEIDDLREALERDNHDDT